MTFRCTNRRRAILLIACICCAHAAAASDETFARAKDLYASAAYDEALAVLDKLEAAAPANELTSIAEYRTFCLLALDRRDEALRSIEAILNANPRYLPSDDQTSPRIQAIFRDTRRRLLPGIVTGRYVAAKAAFERKDPHAADQFDDVLLLLDDPDAKNVPALTDLRTVVSAFRDLTRAMAAVAPPARTGERAADSAPPAPKDRAPGTGAPDAVFTSSDADVTPPVAHAQKIPRWIPPPGTPAQDFKGTVELLIDERGEVASATLRASVHPTYNQRLLSAIRDWKFTPATKHGVPVRYRKIVEIQLSPNALTTSR